jgi:hypothetical protein
MPDFLNFAAQTANIRQSQAAEQNALALMAQRQREEQEAMNVTNALRGFNPSDPNARNRLYQMPGGAAALESISKAETAQTEAAKAAREEQSAARESIMSKLSAYRNPLEMYASLQQAKVKGVLDDLSYTSLTNSLRQHIRKDPVGGLEAFKDEVARGRLSPEQRLEQDVREIDTGTETQLLSRSKYLGGGFNVVNSIKNGLSPQQIADLQLRQQAEDRAERESNQRMYLAQNNISPIAGEPGWGINANGKAVKVPFAASETEPKTFARDPETGGYPRTLGDLDGRPFLEVENADNARRTLITVLGYGTKEFSDTIHALKTAPSGLLNSLASQANSVVGTTDAQRQAAVQLGVLSQALVLGALNFKLGGQVSDADRQAFAEYVGDIKNPNLTIADRLAAFEKFIDLQKRIGFMPKDGYEPFKGKGLPGRPTGGAPRILSGQPAPTVPVAPATGQGTVRAPTPAYTPEEEAAALRKFGVIQ